MSLLGFWSTICAVLLSSLVADAQNMAGLSQSAAMILQQSVVPGRMTRVCNCGEQGTCVANMQMQGKQCSNQCFGVFRRITTRPDLLQNCVQTSFPQLDGFIACVTQMMGSCSSSNQRIPYHDIRTAFNLGEMQLNRNRETILRQPIVSRIRPIAETGLLFGACVKNCFVNQQNGNGFCFDRHGCQPLITPQRLQGALNVCMRRLQWKRHAGQLCQCAKQAGVMGLGTTCSLLSVVG